MPIYYIRAYAHLCCKTNGARRTGVTVRCVGWGWGLEWLVMVMVHVWVFTSTHHGNIRVARHCGECDAMTTHQQCPWFYRVLVSRILVSLKEGGFCLCVCAEVVGAARIDTHCG